SRVELPREERGRRQQNLVGTFELVYLSLEFFDAFSFLSAQPGSFTLIHKRLFTPAVQRLLVDPDPGRDPHSSSIQRQRLIRLTSFQHEPHGSVLQLRRILPSRWHSPHPFG